MQKLLKDWEQAAIVYNTKTRSISVKIEKLAKQCKPKYRDAYARMIERFMERNEPLINETLETLDDLADRLFVSCLDLISI